MPSRHALSDSIIDSDLLLAVIAGVKEYRAVVGKKSRPLSLMSGEGVLQVFLESSLLELAGQMALSGCGPESVRTMHEEVSFLLNVTCEVVTQAHRRLFADLLPQSSLPSVDTLQDDCDQ